MIRHIWRAFVMLAWMFILGFVGWLAIVGWNHHAGVSIAIGPATVELPEGFKRAQFANAYACGYRQAVVDDLQITNAPPMPPECFNFAVMAAQNGFSQRVGTRNNGKPSQ